MLEYEPARNVLHAPDEDGKITSIEKEVLKSLWQNNTELNDSQQYLAVTVIAASAKSSCPSDKRKREVLIRKLTYALYPVLSIQCDAITWHNTMR